MVAKFFFVIRICIVKTSGRMSVCKRGGCGFDPDSEKIIIFYLFVYFARVKCGVEVRHLTCNLSNRIVDNGVSWLKVFLLSLNYYSA